MKYYSFLFLAILVFASCSSDDPEVPNEEEVITTVNYYLTPDNGGPTVTLTFQDLDGDGGNNPTISTSPLAANTNYTGRLEFLNEQESPAEDITEEISEEDLEHQIFFQASNNSITVSYVDFDSDMNPIGLSSTLNTSVAGSTQLTIILRHEPDKSASGVSSGDITNAGGETDIEVTFDLTIQ